MLKQNPEFAKSILFNQVQIVYASLLQTYPSDKFKEQLVKGTRDKGADRVEAYLSFCPQGHCDAQSIDLTFALQCRENRAVFSSEIAWSDGRMIDEVVVCEMCPNCMEDLENRVQNVSKKSQAALIERMVELLENFQEQ